MKYCTQCGRECADGFCYCPACGRPFGERIPSRIPKKRNPLSHADRMALAGFVLSLLGAVSLISTPLQAVGLVLALSARGAERRAFRIFGIVISAVSVLFSLLFWTVFILNAEAILNEIVKSMYY